MKIGINILYLIPGKVGGTETYARELLSALTKEIKSGDELVIFCGRETTKTLSSLSKATIVTLPIYSANRPARIVAEQTILPWLCYKYKVDALFSLGYSAPFIHPFKSIVTIHDLNWYYHPEDFSRVQQFVWHWLTVISAKTANHIIAISTATAHSLMQVMQISKDHISIILHGAPVASKSAKLPNTSNNPYIFSVLAGYPHKNLITLLQAFNQLHQIYPKLNLVICGLSGRSDKMNAEYIQENNLANNVQILGYVSQSKLEKLYRNAIVFVFPSAYEGFGIPVIESMYYGVPIVSANSSSLAEVVSYGGCLVDTFSVDQYIKEITLLLDDRKAREILIKNGRKRILELTWEKTANKTLNILKKISS